MCALETLEAYYPRAFMSKNSRKEIRLGNVMRKEPKTIFKHFSAICVALLLASLPMETVLACKCASGETERSLFDKADYVALVKITGAELRDISELGNSEFDMADEYVRVSFDEIEIFKGAKFSPSYLKEFPYGNGNCMLGLRPGLEYVIFLDKDSQGFVVSCSGSFEFSYGTTSEEVSAKVKELREWIKKKK
jgi:hypothetical protein